MSDGGKIEQRPLFGPFTETVPQGQAPLFPSRGEAAREVVEAPKPCRENEWLGISRLDELRPHILSCRACGLRDGAKGVVFGEGDPHARIMFVGEGPGRTEDETGRPFVGRAGQLLDYALKSIEFARPDVFIANIVKCRPPQNRLPLPPEVQACLPNLKAQMRILRPKIVVLLGALASQTLIHPSIRVTRDRGKWFTKEGVQYLVTFHPAAVLRDEAVKKRQLLDDMRSLREKWEEIGRDR
ncbi:MAG: uracil-DNA glycosylase [Bacillota bacterium]